MLNAQRITPDTPPTPLAKWLAVLQDTDADELAFREAWNAVCPNALLRELADALMQEEDASLRRLLDGLQSPDAPDFLRYLHVESRPPDAEPVDPTRLYLALRGMASGAQALRAALTRDADRMQEALAASASAWSGQEAARPLAALPALSGGPQEWLETGLRQWWEEGGRRDSLAACRDWLNALAAAARGAQEEASASETLDSRRFPLLIHQRGAQGIVAWLQIETVPGGQGELYADPCGMALTPLSEVFREAIVIARRVADSLFPNALPTDSEGRRPDLRWRLQSGELDQNASVVLEGGSHGAAFGIALAQLLRGEMLDPGYAVTATLGADGSFGPVAGVREKCMAAFGLRDAQGAPLIRRVVVHSDNAEEARAAASNALRDPQLAVLKVANLAAYLPEASGLLEQFRNLLSGEEAWIRRDAGQRTQREFHSWKEFNDFCVPSRVSRGVVTSALDPDLPAEKRQAHFLVSWEQIALELDAELRRAVVLGDPGHGKTVLLWQSAGHRCVRARQILATQPETMHGVQFALFLRAGELAETLADKATRANPLLDAAVSLAAARHGLRDAFRDYLRHRIRDGQCLLCLDGMDEAPRDARAGLEAALQMLFQRSPQARVLLSSRREGYAREANLIPLEGELETQPFDEGQMHRAIHVWFQDQPLAAQSLWDNLQNARHLRYVLTSPLLLRIACQSAEEALRATHSLPNWNRRVELYQAFLKDMTNRWAQRPPYPSLAQRQLFLYFAAEIALAHRDRKRRGEQAELAEIANQIVQAQYAVFASRPVLEDLCGAGILMSLGTGGGAEHLVYTHETFGEFLSALALARRAQEYGWEDIAEFVNGLANLPDQQEVIIFLAGMLPDPLPLLLLLSDPARDDVFRHRLALAARCLPEVTHLLSAHETA